MTIRMTLVLCFAASVANAQLFSGSRLFAIADNAAAVTDPWSIQRNPAGLAGAQTLHAAIAYQRNLSLADLATQAAIVSMPVRRHVFALSVQRYGIPEYRRISLGSAIAKTFDKLSIGLAIHYHQTITRGYPTLKNYSITTGGQYEVSRLIRLGGYVRFYSGRDRIKIESNKLFWSGGVNFKPNENVLIAAGVDKAQGQKPDPGIGVDYEILPDFFVRGGTKLSPFRHHAGFGLKLKQISIQVAVSANNTAGYSPQIELGRGF